MNKTLDFKFNDKDMGDVRQSSLNLSEIEVDIKEGTEAILINKQDIIELAKIFNLHVYEKENKL